MLFRVAMQVLDLLHTNSHLTLQKLYQGLRLFLIYIFSFFCAVALWLSKCPYLSKLHEGDCVQTDRTPPVHVPESRCRITCRGNKLEGRKCRMRLNGPMMTFLPVKSSIVGTSDNAGKANYRRNVCVGNITDTFDIDKAR